MSRPVPIMLMRDYSISVELRTPELQNTRTVFSRNMLDADQLIQVASQFGIQYSLESDTLFLSNPVKHKGQNLLYSLKLHLVGKKPTSLKEFRRVAKFISATTL